MRALNPFTLFPHITPGTCRRCLGKQYFTFPNVAGFSTKTAKGRGRRRKKAPVVLTAAAGTLGAGTLFFTDDLKHGYAAVERSARVLSTLAVCMNEFVDPMVHLESRTNESTIKLSNYFKEQSAGRTREIFSPESLSQTMRSADTFSLREKRLNIHQARPAPEQHELSSPD